MRFTEKTSYYYTSLLKFVFRPVLVETDAVL